MEPCYTYWRWSGKPQGSGSSKERQQRDVEGYLASAGLNLATDGVFIDDGRSGWTGENVDFGQLGDFLRRARAGTLLRPVNLVIEQFDRLTRQEWRRARDMVEELWELGVTIHEASTGDVYRPDCLDDPDSAVKLLQKYVQNNRYSAEISRRVRRGRDRQRRQDPDRPVSGRVPAWCRIDPATGRPELDDDKAKTLRQIIALAFAGRGNRFIARRLRDAGTPHFAGEGHVWNDGYIGKLLRNQALKGEFTHRGFRDGERVDLSELIPEFFPRVLSDDEFNALQDVISQRDKKGGRTDKGIRSLFGALVFDARDGRKMQVKHKDRGRRVTHLSPYGMADGPADGPARYFPYQVFEDTFRRLFHEDVAEDLLREGPKGSALRVSAIHGRRSELARLRAYWEQEGMKEGGAKAAARMLRKIDDEDEALLAELETLNRRSTNNHLANLGQMRDQWQAEQTCRPEHLADERVKLRAAIGRLVDQIWVLVEGERGDRWATVQVFLRNNSWVRYTIHQDGGHTLWAYGPSTCNPAERDDLRKWRQHSDPKPTFERPKPSGVVWTKRERETSARLAAEAKK